MTSPVRFVLNGRDATAVAEPTMSLLQLLRDGLGCFGVRAGCRQGGCGSCSVLVDDRLVLACLVPATRVDGARVVTVEGLASGGRLSAVQAAFVAEGATQCGYCSSGMVLAVTALLKENPQPSEDDVQEAIAGNVCRCTGYLPIVRAALRAAREATVEERG
jgi:aerobic carbon-monoxide dehydrogenase small subunit